MPKKSYVGIDIGTSGIKVVQLESYRGLPKLITYGYAEAYVDVIRDQSRKLVSSTAHMLGQILQRARVTSMNCIVSLPTFAVFSSIINLPRMSRSDLETAVKWEAKKFVPLPMEEMILDWMVLEGGQVSLAERLFMMNIRTLLKKREVEKLKQAASLEAVSPAEKKGLFGKRKEQPEQQKNEKEKDTRGALSEPEKEGDEVKRNVRVLLIAAPKNLVTRYVEIFKLARLKLLSLETEALALSRSLIGADKESVMVIDIGSGATNICLIEAGVPVVNRGLDIGGYHITKSISDSLNVSFERAEQFKLDFGIKMQEQPGALPEAIKGSLDPIVNEIQYVFDLYQSQGRLTVDRVMLVGGSAFLPNLTTYLSQLLKIPVYIGNPWDRVVYPLDLKPVLEGIGPQMAVAVGLAMRNIV